MPIILLSGDFDTGLGILLTGSGSGSGFFEKNSKFTQEHRTGFPNSRNLHRKTGQDFLHRQDRKTGQEPDPD